MIEQFFKSNNSLYFKFRFATPMDLLLLTIGAFGSLANGASFPLMMYLFTNIIDTFTGFEAQPCPSKFVSII